MAASAHILPGGGNWFVDPVGNKWALDASGHPFVNDSFIDPPSHCAFLELWGGTIWQQEATTNGAWWACTPTVKLTSAAQLSSMWQLLPSPWPTPPVSGTGPAATGFLAVDYLAPRPEGSGAQQVLSRRLYGVSTGGAGDNNFAALTNPTYQQLAGQVNPGLWWFKNSGQQYWNADLSVNPASLANLVGNFPKLDPLGVSGVAFIIDWSMVPGGQGNPSLYATAMANLARYLSNVVMPNGRKFPLVLMQGFDEPDGQGADAVANYYRAMIPAVKAAAPGVLVAGPGCSYISWADFGSKVPIDVFSYNYFRAGYTQADQPGVAAVLSANFAPIQDSANTAQGNIKATLFGGVGLDWNCCVPDNNTFIGALFHAFGVITSLDRAKLPLWACIWDAFGDGTCGIIKDPANWATPGGTIQITPKGYLLAEAVRHAYGPRFQTSANAAGLLCAGTVPSTGHCSMFVVNAGRGAQLGKTVAMSHWPVNSSGNGTARVWQMGMSCNGPGIDGTVRNATVAAGVLTCDFPDPSVTIISV